MKASSVTITTIIIAVGVALLSCFSLVRLIVLAPETSIPVTPTQINQIGNTGDNLRKRNDDDIVNFKFRNQIITATVARSEQKQAFGLMNITSLNENQGMIFIFDDLQPRTFWMKDTPLSLDIIYLDEKLRVVNLYNKTLPNQTSIVYPSVTPSSYVLELQGGNAETLNLKVGDILTLE